MKIILLFIFVCCFECAGAQELFVYAEPASNMPAKSIATRLNNYFTARHDGKINYYFAPEIMWGISKKWMLHVEGFFDNSPQNLQATGGSLYLKYRFYSADDIHSHFRLSAFGRAATNSSFIEQPAIDLAGRNSGYEAGMIATKLQNKIAFSATVSFLHATDQAKKHISYRNDNGNDNRNALAYIFSLGKLVLPKAYTSFRQTNVNIMLDVPAQTDLRTGKTYLDVAPAIQFIFLSKMRVDVGYRLPLLKQLGRAENPGFLLRLEYNFFNIYK